MQYQKDSTELRRLERKEAQIAEREHQVDQARREKVVVRLLTQAEIKKVSSRMRGLRGGRLVVSSARCARLLFSFVFTLADISPSSRLY